MNIEIVSVHVPKTAGMSFRRVLDAVYGEDAVFADNGEYMGNSLADMPLTPQHRIIHGHAYRTTEQVRRHLVDRRKRWSL
ncbi:MAG: hypothetical protein NTW36_14940 [Planctomycetia bacterium]|nr:hypothetical protein [Planctomycetia bacterium]